MTDKFSNFVKMPKPAHRSPNSTKPFFPHSALQLHVLNAEVSLISCPKNLFNFSSELKLIFCPNAR